MWRHLKTLLDSWQLGASGVITDYLFQINMFLKCFIIYRLYHL